MKAPSNNKIEICTWARLCGPGRAPQGSGEREEGRAGAPLASPGAAFRWESFCGGNRSGGREAARPTRVRDGIQWKVNMGSNFCDLKRDTLKKKKKR